MREYRGNLKRAHQAEARHVGRRHRRNVLPLVQNSTRGRLQELGQKIETGRLAGPVGTDQRMNTAATDPKIDIANGEEARKFFRQSLGFENELIGQSNFPRQPSRNAPSRVVNFYNGRLSRTSWNSSWTRRLRGGICRQRPSLRKVESWADSDASSGRFQPLVERRKRQERAAGRSCRAHQGA